jgi:hypothetical protein
MDEQKENRLKTKQGTTMISQQPGTKPTPTPFSIRRPTIIEVPALDYF